MDPEKVDAVKLWQKSANTKELHSFIGFCSYYCRFIAGFIDVVQPLYNCLEGTLFVWPTEAEQVFRKMKLLCIQTVTPVLG